MLKFWHIPPNEFECTEDNPALRQLYERIARGHTLAEAEELQGG